MSLRARPILFAYCILAVAVLLTLAGRVIWLSNEAGRQLGALRNELAQAEEKAGGCEAVFKRLEAEQRAHRADYQGQEAIAASIAVQNAKDEFTAASDERDRLKGEVDERAAATERRTLLLVPLIALVLLHAVGGLSFRPRRG